MKLVFQMLQQTFRRWSDDKAPQLAAALAFYSLLSVGPLLLIAISVAGLIFGADAASGEITRQLEQLIGKSGAETITSVIANSRNTSSNILATLAGFVTLFIGAAGVFVQLQDSLNTIWKAPASPQGGFWYFIRKRLLSFSMVLGIGFLLLISLLLSAALSILGHYFIGWLPQMAPLLESLNSLVTLLVVTLLFAMIFKILPDVSISWRDVREGAFLSALLFTMGKYLIGIYLGSSAVATTYGAAGSFIILALWVYYSGLILFFGAELTYVYSNRFHVPPAGNGNH